MTATFLAFLVGFAPALSQAGDNWPQFRGEGAAGIASGEKLPAKWSTIENVAWKTVIPGHGWSSPIVWGDRVYLTSFVSAEKVVAPKAGFYGPRMTKTPQGEHHWTVYCLDANTGKKIWEKAAVKAQPGHPIHVKSSYAAETPVTDGERVYACFGNVGVFCFDMDGDPVWEKKWPAARTQLGWGTGSSPALHEGRLYVLNDSEDQSYLMALDAKSGKELWRTDRNEKSSWATPFIWKNDRRTEIVTCARQKVRSYDLDGKLLWQLGGMSSLCIPTPVTAHGLLFVNSGYEFARPRPLMAIRPGASGDISLKDDETSNEFVAWYREPAGSYHPSPLVVGDRLYVVYSRGFVASFDARTGKDAWGRQRLKGTFTSSPWAYGGKIFCLNEQGTTFVLDAGAEFKILGTNDLEEMTMATPAVSGDRLYIRTLTRLYCFRAPEK